jgi:opacity protein-like surface antigen
MEEIVKTSCALLLSFLVVLIGLASPAFGADRPGTYVALKGGIYSSSASFDLKNLDVEDTFDADTKSGVDGEIAIGHYVLPTLALELGVGYFKGEGSLQTTPTRQLDFNVIPVIASVKALIPAGPVDPYGEAGIGAYFTDLEVEDNLNSFRGTTTFGLHGGAGVNVNVTEKVFVGVEARYVWANPSVGEQKIRLNEEEFALNGFELNGFTTTLVLGYGF